MNEAKMDLDQIITRLDWLDEERRKDKTVIMSMDERLKGIESSVRNFGSQYNELSGEMTRLTVLLSRIEQVEGTISQVKVDLTRSIDNVEKQRVDGAREYDKTRRADLESINKSVGDIQKGLEGMTEIKKTLQLRVDEEFRLSKLIDGLKKEIEESKRGDEDYKRTQRIMEDNHRQDSKRLSDLQGEVSALRKRSDEQRGKVDLFTETTRKMDLRINELQASETERKQGQNVFIEKQNMYMIDRERIWKEWNQQFEDIIQKAVSIDSQIQTLEATNRAVKRSQEAFDDIIQRFDRRVNEITEMQRLVEERFRQEWVNFKADDQKRWTNYTLASEEKQREVSRQIDKQNDRLILVEDSTQEIRDLVRQINEEIQNRLQGLLALSHQWMDDYDQLFGKTRQA
jgi:DNA repair exonuclease SbcCD ATPase subunit